MKAYCDYIQDFEREERESGRTCEAANGRPPYYRSLCILERWEKDNGLSQAMPFCCYFPFLHCVEVTDRCLSCELNRGHDMRRHILARGEKQAAEDYNCDKLGYRFN